MVDIDGPPACRAGPPRPLAFNERTDTIFFNCSKVVKHAHVVLCPVPRVQMFHPFAGKFAAGMVVPVLHMLTGRDGAVNTTQPVRCITSSAPVLLPQERNADGAVHAAGSDQGGPEWIFHRHTKGWVPGQLIIGGRWTTVLPVLSPGRFFFLDGGRPEVHRPTPASPFIGIMCSPSS